MIFLLIATTITQFKFLIQTPLIMIFKLQLANLKLWQPIIKLEADSLGKLEAKAAKVHNKPNKNKQMHPRLFKGRKRMKTKMVTYNFDLSFLRTS